MIIDHHSTFKLLYKDKNLKKKHHNMVHYTSAIRKLGSLLDYCTLRFEGKHSFFKTTHRVSHNYKNIPKTISKQHQISLANSLINSDLLNKELLILDGKEITVKNLNADLKFTLKKITNLIDTDNITIAKKIEYYGQLYKRDFIVSKLNNNELFFYSILNIFINKVLR